MRLKDPVTAHLIAEAELPQLNNGAEVRLGHWRWLEEGLPSDPLAHQLPGGHKGGIFKPDHVRVELPKSAKGVALSWGGNVELTIGVRSYFTLAWDILPVAWAGPLWIPDRQQMWATFRSWHWTGGGPTPPEGTARLVLAGKWAAELEQ
jgi:hypothetical protein